MKNDTTNPCPACGSDPTDKERLSEIIQRARSWFADHPHQPDQVLTSSNTKQMMLEACDFSEIVLICLSSKMVQPAYANLRHVLERAYVATNLLATTDVDWEKNGVARQQVILSKLQNIPDLNQAWMKERLANIRQWNGQPNETEKPKSLLKPSTYTPKWVSMPTPMKEYYELLSLHVHPTYWGTQNIGRTLHQPEEEFVTKLTHVYTCLTVSIAKQVEEIIKAAPQ